MRGLLQLIREHPAAVEADLSRYHQASLADLAEGRLSLWQVWARVRYLPVESATAQAQGHGDGWDMTSYLVADVYQILTEKPHPADPRIERARRARLADKQRRVDDIAEFDRERLAATGTRATA